MAKARISTRNKGVQVHSSTIMQNRRGPNILRSRAQCVEAILLAHTRAYRVAGLCYFSLTRNFPLRNRDLLDLHFLQFHSSARTFSSVTTFHPFEHNHRVTWAIVLEGSQYTMFRVSYRGSSPCKKRSIATGRVWMMLIQRGL